MRFRRSALVVAIAAALFMPALALASPFTATYSFAASAGSQAFEPVDVNPVGVIFSAITRGPGIAPVAGLNSINSDGWSTAAAIDLNDYYEFTITPNAGFEMDITRLAFSYRRSGAGPREIEVRHSLDGFTATFLGISLPDLTANNRVDITNMAGFAGTLNLTSQITFRIYAYAAELAGGTFRLGTALGEANEGLPANLEVGGDLAAVPEPATLLLIGAGVSALRLRRRRG
jgi:hypothetical protein